MVDNSERSKHCFAFYYPQLSLFTHSDTIIIKQEELVRRISLVLRMKVTDQCILFDRVINVLCLIIQINQKTIIVKKTVLYNNIPLHPFVILYLPILKRNNLEQAVSLAVHSGVSAIQLVITDQSSSLLPAMKNRLEKLIIAACEESKYYIPPLLYSPVLLIDAINTAKSEGNDCYSFVCSIDGVSFLKLVSNYLPKDNVLKSWNCGIFFGPENDFTQKEYAYFHEKKFHMVSLGSLVLPSALTACIAVSLIRSSFFIKN